MYIIIAILVCSISTLAKPIPSLKLSDRGKLHIAMSGYIVNQQITLNNFIKVLKTFTSKYDDFAKKWIESGLESERMLNVEPLLILATDDFENQSIKKTEFVYKALNSNNDGKIDVLKYRTIGLLCDIPIDISNEYDMLLIAMGEYIVNQQITLNNFIKALKKFGSKYDNFGKKWIDSELQGERLLNVEPLLILATDDFENQSIKKTEFVYKALNSNNDGKIDVLKYRTIGLLCDIPIDTSSKREELMIAMGGYIVNQQITLNNFIKALKKFGSIYDNFAKKWIESEVEGERMLNVEPLLKLATDNFAGQRIKRIATIFKAVDSNNDGKISFIEGGNICLLCDISLDTYVNTPYKGNSISKFLSK
ncbi:uncharacterized protein LOC126900358 [Daktulosphaira vitifoliae]|uniref:uncharacterized protein LOC126900358 n=1 Tax=Daktulosphaira vitifoliae TaxID=58002 RepID=UPI0021AAAD78|nr:uncharacterized protein LOC126900358 [Daktulosphaira vitifoliae]